jgi:soluble lytic murein transglycosylase-like protein
MRRLVVVLVALVTLTACTPEEWARLEALAGWVWQEEVGALVEGRPCPQYADEIAWHGLPEHFHGVIWRESHCDPFAVSPAGALGVAQIMPFWLRDLCPRLIACTREDLFDPGRNLAAARYVLDVQGPSAWSATW